MSSWTWEILFYFYTKGKDRSRPQGLSPGLPPLFIFCPHNVSAQGGWAGFCKMRELGICSGESASVAVPVVIHPWDLEPIEKSVRDQIGRPGPYRPYFWKAAQQNVAWICGYHGTRVVPWQAQAPILPQWRQDHMLHLRQGHLVLDTPKSRTTCLPLLSHPWAAKTLTEVELEDLGQLVSRQAQIKFSLPNLFCVMSLSRRGRIFSPHQAKNSFLWT